MADIRSGSGSFQSRISGIADTRRRAEQAVRVELALPHAAVLLSGFETWHCVLNRWHCSLSSRGASEWDRKVKGYNQFPHKLPAALEAELQATWGRIFELDQLRRTRLWGPVKRVQGVAERLVLSQVRRVQYFVDR